MAIRCAELKIYLEQLWDAGIPFPASHAAQLLNFDALDDLHSAALRTRDWRNIAYTNLTRDRATRNRLLSRYYRLLQDYYYTHALVQRYPFPQNLATINYQFDRLQSLNADLNSLASLIKRLDAAIKKHAQTYTRYTQKHYHSKDMWAT